MHAKCRQTPWSTCQRSLPLPQVQTASPGQVSNSSGAQPNSSCLLPLQRSAKVSLDLQIKAAKVGDPQWIEAAATAARCNASWMEESCLRHKLATLLSAQRSHILSTVLPTSCCASARQAAAGASRGTKTMLQIRTCTRASL